MTIVSAIAVQELEVELDSSAPQSLVDLGFDANKVKVADYVHISSLDTDIFYGYGGAAIDATTGHPIENGADKVIAGRGNAEALTLIASTGTARLFITLSKG